MAKTSHLSRGDEETPDVPISPGGIVAGKYRIDAVIGFGGMWIVCEGFHLDLETKVEVHIARREHVNDERAVAQCLSEARSAAQLQSQHTRRVMDCGRLDVGAPYIVVECLDGADLGCVRSAHRPLPVEDALSFALQACEALGEAHSRGLVHGDLKPENLFLTHGPDGSALIKVRGLGVSKQLGRLPGSGALTESAESVGLPQYMSPEQRIDPTAVDARTDIWSLGVLLHELLTGELPHEGSSATQAAIPESLAAIVLRCMDRNRDARFPDAAALGRALKAFGGFTSSVTRERVEEILRQARSSRPESETPQSVAAAPEPESVADAPESVPAPTLPRSIPALPVVPSLPIPLSAPQSEPVAPRSIPTTARSAPPALHSVPVGGPSRGPPPLPPTHSPPAPTPRQLVARHGPLLALAGVVLGAFVALLTSHRARPDSEPSSASASSTAARGIAPAQPVVLPSAAPAASPAPPPVAQTTASEPARKVTPPHEPVQSATPPSAPPARPARRRAWSLYPELKQPVLPPNVR